MLTICRLVAGAYGKPDVQGLTGETPVAVIDGQATRWTEEPDGDAGHGETAAGD